MIPWATHFEVVETVACVAAFVKDSCVGQCAGCTANSSNGYIAVEQFACFFDDRGMPRLLPGICFWQQENRGCVEGYIFHGCRRNDAHTSFGSYWIDGR